MSATCTYCGDECEGTSGIARPDGGLDPYCHEGESPTCYEQAGQILGAFGLATGRVVRAFHRENPDV